MELPETQGPTHPYIGASPACWEMYGEALARSYGEFRYPACHRLTVDAYAVQHPGVPERRSIGSVGLHLMRLCAVLERDLALRDGASAMREVAARRPAFHWLQPPRAIGTITVRDVLGARDVDEYCAWAERWARDVWSAWSAHHPTVRMWLDG